jgi:hypothetical protein
MKIYSNFKDYYDGVSSYGYDDSISYIRNSNVYDINSDIVYDQFFDIRSGYTNRKLFDNSFSFKVRTLDLTYYRFKIGFCGTWYNFIRVFEKGFVNYYSSDTLEYKKITTSRFLMSKNLASDITNDELFIKYNAPVLLLKFKEEYRNKFEIITNPILTEFNFFQIKDSYTAYQEIEQYLSNILVKEKPIIKLSENDRIIKAGFDTKQSFRHRKP